MRTAFSATTSSAAARKPTAMNELSTVAAKKAVSQKPSSEKTGSVKLATRSARGAKTEGADAAAEQAYYWPLGVTAVPREDFRLAAATAGDHAAIHQLLTTVFQGPSRDDFSASLEDPLYEPCDRLIVKRG